MYVIFSVKSDKNLTDRPGLYLGLLCVNCFALHPVSLFMLMADLIWQESGTTNLTRVKGSHFAKGIATDMVELHEISLLLVLLW